MQYWPNGKLKEKYFQKYDFFKGSFKSWNEEGTLTTHVEFDDDGNLLKRII